MDRLAGAAELLDGPLDDAPALAGISVTCGGPTGGWEASR